MAKEEKHGRVREFLKSHDGGDHMHIEGHEHGYTTHSIHDGKMHGPEEHSNMQALKRHVGHCMGDDCECPGGDCGSA